MLGKEKGYKLDDALSEGKIFEAILAGKSHVQHFVSAEPSNVDAVKHPCRWMHSPRKCLAYNFCNKRGHWGKFWHQQNKTRQKNYDGKRTHRKFHDIKIKQQSPYWFRRRELGSLPLHKNFKHAKWCVCNNGYRMSRERKSLTNKIKDGYGSSRQHAANAYILPDVKINSHCSHAKKREKHLSDGIQWFNKLTAQDQYVFSLAQTAANSMKPNSEVAVDGPPINKLLTCKVRKFITIHCDHVVDSIPDFTTTKNLRKTYQNLFDSLDNLKEPAYKSRIGTLHWAPPQKCSVHLKNKPKNKFQKMKGMRGDHQAYETTYKLVFKHDILHEKKMDHCVYIDPQNLNQALERWIFSLPVLVFSTNWLQNLDTGQFLWMKKVNYSQRLGPHSEDIVALDCHLV